VGRHRTAAGTPVGSNPQGSRDSWAAGGTPRGRDTREKGPMGSRDPSRLGPQGSRDPSGLGPQGARAQGTMHPPHLEGHLHPVVHPLLQHEGPAPQYLQVSCTGSRPMSPAPLPSPPSPPPRVPPLLTCQVHGDGPRRLLTHQRELRHLHVGHAGIWGQSGGVRTSPVCTPQPPRTRQPAHRGAPRPAQPPQTPRAAGVPWGAGGTVWAPTAVPPRAPGRRRLLDRLCHPNEFPGVPMETAAVIL